MTLQPEGIWLKLSLLLVRMVSFGPQSSFIKEPQTSIHAKVKLKNENRGSVLWYSSCTVDFFPHFCCRFETSSIHFKSRESDISHGPIDDLASKLINYITTSVKKVPIYIKRCESISKFDRIAEHLRVFLKMFCNPVKFAN